MMGVIDAACSLIQGAAQRTLKDVSTFHFQEKAKKKHTNHKLKAGTRDLASVKIRYDDKWNHATVLMSCMALHMYGISFQICAYSSIFHGVGRYRKKRVRMMYRSHTPSSMCSKRFRSSLLLALGWVWSLAIDGSFSMVKKKFERR